MQQKELLENLAALKIQVCYRAYRGRVMSAKLRENLVIDLRTRLDEETKMRMAYEIKINAHEEERRQMEEEEGQEAVPVSNSAMRAIQAQLVAVQNALDEQVAESSSLREEADKSKDDARSAAAETLGLRDKIQELQKNQDTHKAEGRQRGESMSSPAKTPPPKEAKEGMSPEQMQAEIEKDVKDQLAQEEFDDDEAAKDEILFELSEKLDEAEDELERKEELMKEMMDIINQLEEAQMVRELEGGKETEDYKALQEEFDDLKMILEEQMTKGEEAEAECDGLKKDMAEANASLEDMRKSLESAQGSSGEVAAELEALSSWKGGVLQKLRAVNAGGGVGVLQKSMRELKGQATTLFGEQKEAWAQLSTGAMGALDTLSKENGEVMELYKKECKTRKVIHNKLIELQGNIRVFLRVRPALPGEDDSECPFGFPMEDQVTLCGKRFDYDRVFKRTAVQTDVFTDTAPLVVSALDGYNVCIFAYGQTGSGKTFTMEGSRDNMGVNFRAISDLFANIEQRKAQNIDYTLTASILEIYNDEVHDLLDPATEQKKMDVRQGPDGVFVPDLTWKTVEKGDDIIDLTESAKKNRTVCATKMNQESSRSHSILTVKLTGHNKTTNENIKATLNLIDLAGSERVSKSEVSGQQLKEAQNINKSLSYLGDVIAARASKAGHVPYRNCKLTYLLQDALSGDSKCLMFVCANPCADNAGESLCSLNFASRVRSVEMGKAKKNVSKAKVEGESPAGAKGPRRGSTAGK